MDPRPWLAEAVPRDSLQRACGFHRSTGKDGNVEAKRLSFEPSVGATTAKRLSLSLFRFAEQQLRRDMQTDNQSTNHLEAETASAGEDFGHPTSAAQ